MLDLDLDFDFDFDFDGDPEKLGRDASARQPLAEESPCKNPFYARYIVGSQQLGGSFLHAFTNGLRCIADVFQVVSQHNICPTYRPLADLQKMRTVAAKLAVSLTNSVMPDGTTQSKESP